MLITCNHGNRRCIYLWCKYTGSQEVCLLSMVTVQQGDAFLSLTFWSVAPSQSWTCWVFRTQSRVLLPWRSCRALWARSVTSTWCRPYGCRQSWAEFFWASTANRTTGSTWKSPSWGRSIKVVDVTCSKCLNFIETAAPPFVFHPYLHTTLVFLLMFPLWQCLRWEKLGCPTFCLTAWRVWKLLRGLVVLAAGESIPSFFHLVLRVEFSCCLWLNRWRDECFVPLTEAHLSLSWLFFFLLHTKFWLFLSFLRIAKFFSHFDLLHFIWRHPSQLSRSPYSRIKTRD